MRLTFIVILFLLPARALCQQCCDTTPLSTKQKALSLLQSKGRIAQSIHWPNVDPDKFIENLKSNVINPLSVYEGSNTNFCGPAALTYFPLHYDPVTYVERLIELYADGKTNYNGVVLQPSARVKKQAGLLMFKGALDIHPADQLWFLTIADEFKSYINLLNYKYDPGDENKLWASVTYGKFNKMVRKLFNLKVVARGADIIKPRLRNLVAYVQEKLKSGTTVLYVNNNKLYNRTTRAVKKGSPTHFIVVLDLKVVGKLIHLTYWDYGFRSVTEISPALLKKITYGVSHFSIKSPR